VAVTAQQVKIVVLINKHEAMSREDFLHHWQVQHPAVVWRLPGLRRYVQNPSIDHRSVWAYDGLAELWFDSLSDVKTAFDSPEAAELFRQEEAFIAKTAWFITTETEVPNPFE
jgi:uncharacterized protein (TIGR02118 family)